MRLLNAIRAVLWGLFGIRRRADAARDAEMQPRTIAAAVAVLFVIVVGGIATGVHFIASNVAPQRAPSRHICAPP